MIGESNMPNLPFGVYGKVYDIDGSTLVASLTVTLENATNHETISGTTDANGQYSLDGANLDSGVSANDVLFLRISNSNKSAEVLAKVSASDITTGFWNQDIYLRCGRMVNPRGGVSLYSAWADVFSAENVRVFLLDRSSASGVEYNVRKVLSAKLNHPAQFNTDYPLLFENGIRVIKVNAPTKTNTSVTVGASSVSVLAANTLRDSVVLTNDSDTDIHVSLGATAVINEGILLAAHGGSLVLEGAEATGAIYAISSAATKNLCVTHNVLSSVTPVNLTANVANAIGDVNAQNVIVSLTTR